MNNIGTLFGDLEKRFEKPKTKYTPRNNSDDIKEQIWEIVERLNPKASRKMFFIKTGGVPDYELLNLKKWAESTDNFCRAFYGGVKKYHRKKAGLQN